MANIMIVGNNMHGMINISLGVTEGLAKRGHSVTYWVGDIFKKYIEDYGVPHRSLYYPQSKYPLHTISVCLQCLEATDLFLRNHLAEIRRSPPDGIVCTWDALPGLYLARQLGVPLAVITPFPVGKMFLDAFWKDNSVDRFRPQISASVEQDIRDQFARLRNSLWSNFQICLPDDLESCSWAQTTNSPDERRIDIVANSKGFLGDFADDAPHRHYVGSLVRSRDWSRLEAFPIGCLDERPLVYVALGTLYSNNQRFFDCCAEAFADERMQVVYSLPAGGVDTSRKPRNFILTSLAPQLSLLRLADVFVSHGGVNSVHEGFAAKVPMIVCPQGYDQYVTADLIEKADAGYVLNPESVTAASLKEGLEELLYRHWDRANLEKVSSELASSGGINRTCDILEEHFLFNQPATAVGTDLVKKGSRKGLDHSRYFGKNRLCHPLSMNQRSLLHR